MRKRRVISLGIVVSASLFAGLVTWCALVPTQEAAFRAKRDQIEFGMTKAQVEGVFGERGSPHNTNDVPDFYKGHYTEAWEWTCGESGIVVYLNANARISGIQSNIEREPPFVERALTLVREFIP